MIKNVKFDDKNLIYRLQIIFNEVYHQKDELKNEFVNNPYTEIYVYEESNEILGIIHINNIYDRFEINNIFVLSEYRHRGIASALMEKVITIGKEQKIKNITLEVRKDNFSAINLYKKYGFLEKAIRMGYYNGIDGLLMQKDMIDE